MKILIFGATGMVGQGVLRECLRARDVKQVVTVGRSKIGSIHPKVKEIVSADLSNLGSIESQLTGFDACFFCLGVSSSGMSEGDYTRVSYDLTLAAGETLSRVHPGMTFIYVSGAGTDSTEKGRVMWARVKGRTENALLQLPMQGYMFRPGFIAPMDGIQSKTRAYRNFYKLLGPLPPLLCRIFPNQILSTREMGRAMLAVARRGYRKHILETRDLRAVL